MIIDPNSISPQNNYKLLVGAVVPRPIAFVSTVSPDGARNLAPFSFFTVASANPPVVCFTTSFREPRKDTLVNVRATGEFVVNIVSAEFAEKMNVTSGEYPYGVDEFAVAGLTPVPSELVRPSRVKEAHVNMECRLLQTVEVSNQPLGGTLVLGEVVRFHVDDAIIEDFRIDPAKLDAVGRMAGNTYCRTRDRFDMIRPQVEKK
ncbi:MAG TPA: flavin reductase family protein [Bryobacteraceae bacterium]|nr:flavin reductase family protein [Bryobacteraceae bacterium]